MKVAMKYIVMQSDKDREKTLDTLANLTISHFRLLKGLVKAPEQE